MGRVRVAAPHHLNEEAIRLAIVERLPWIKKQRKQLLDANRQTERRMVSGETHYVWGERFRLDATREGRSNVSVQSKTLWLTSPAGSEHQRSQGDSRSVVSTAAQGRGTAATWPSGSGSSAWRPEGCRAPHED